MSYGLLVRLLLPSSLLEAFIDYISTRGKISLSCDSRGLQDNEGEEEIIKVQYALIGVYLVAIIIANLLVAHFGTNAVLPIGFFLIGLDLTTRDSLHEMWRKHLWLKMALLICVGSTLSWLLNKDAGQVALASFVAFLSAGIVDTLSYHILRKRTFLIKVNGSNIFSSFADSSIFLTIAFGSFMPLLILAQFGVKVCGGFMWSLLLKRFRGINNAVLLRNTCT